MMKQDTELLILTHLSNFSFSHAKRKNSRAFLMLKHKKDKTEMILPFLVELCTDSANFSGLNGDICSEPLLTLSQAGYLPQQTLIRGVVGGV